MKIELCKGQRVEWSDFQSLSSASPAQIAPSFDLGSLRAAVHEFPLVSPLPGTSSEPRAPQAQTALTSEITTDPCKGQRVEWSDFQSLSSASPVHTVPSFDLGSLQASVQGPSSAPSLPCTSSEPQGQTSAPWAQPNHHPLHLTEAGTVYNGQKSFSEPPPQFSAAETISMWTQPPASHNTGEALPWGQGHAHTSLAQPPLPASTSVSPRPLLSFVKQPVPTFRFRYMTEPGSHGSLTAATPNPNPSTAQQHTFWPTIQLENFWGRVEVEVSLYTWNADPKQRRPHENLRFQVAEGHGRGRGQQQGQGQQGARLEDLKEKLVYTLTEQQSHYCELRGITVIKLTKENLQKLGKTLEEANRIYRVYKGQDVCLGVKAFHRGALIAGPMFSNKITNQKKVSKLAITRRSLFVASSAGGEELWLLTDRASNGNIEVRVEDDEGWSAVCTQVDVHHQHTITCRIPPYKMQDYAEPVTVKLFLLRPSDGERGQHCDLKYKPDSLERPGKKRRHNTIEGNTGNPARVPFGVTTNQASPSNLPNATKPRHLSHPQRRGSVPHQPTPLQILNSCNYITLRPPVNPQPLHYSHQPQLSSGLQGMHGLQDAQQLPGAPFIQNISQLPANSEKHPTSACITGHPSPVLSSAGNLSQPDASLLAEGRGGGGGEGEGEGEAALPPLEYLISWLETNTAEIAGSDLTSDSVQRQYYELDGDSISSETNDVKKEELEVEGEDKKEQRPGGQDLSRDNKGGECERSDPTTRDEDLQEADRGAEGGLKGGLKDRSKERTLDDGADTVEAREMVNMNGRVRREESGQGGSPRITTTTSRREGASGDGTVEGGGEDDETLDINDFDDAGYTALHLAVCGGDSTAVRLLLEEGSKVNLQAQLTGDTALHLAARDDSPQLLSLLLCADTDLFTVNYAGKTFLDLVRPGSRAHQAVQDHPRTKWLTCGGVCEEDESEEEEDEEEEDVDKEEDEEGA